MGGWGGINCQKQISTIHRAPSHLFILRSTVPALGQSRGPVCALTRTRDAKGSGGISAVSDRGCFSARHLLAEPKMPSILHACTTTPHPTHQHPHAKTQRRKVARAYRRGGAVARSPGMLLCSVEEEERRRLGRRR